MWHIYSGMDTETLTILFMFLIVVVIGFVAACLARYWFF